MSKQLKFDSLILKTENRLADGALTSAPLDHESLMVNTDRYADPLVIHRMHLLEDPYAREKNAAQDAICNTITWGFQERGIAELPKFYAESTLEAEPIMEDVRQLLKDIGYKEFSIVVKTLCQIHGWAVMIVWTDEKGALDYYIFSEYQCPPGQWIRDRENPNPFMRNRVLGWRLLSRERLPLNRSASTIVPVYQTIMRDMPGVFYVTRGDEKTSKGFGYSRLEKVWDSIVKLREESHANALRARVFPISVVPADWKKPQVENYFDKISKMDQTTALVTKAGKNPDGTAVPELPAFNWISPGTSANNKSNQGGSGAISDLSSEWARLCAGLMYNVAYFFGAGTVSASKAAGGVDEFDDTQTDIDEWKMTEEFDVQFIRWLGEMANMEVPPMFTIKSHWEWERDEMMLAQVQMQQQELELKKEAPSSTENQSLYKKKNKILDFPLERAKRYGVNLSRLFGKTSSQQYHILDEMIEEYEEKPHSHHIVQFLTEMFKDVQSGDVYQNKAWDEDEDLPEVQLLNAVDPRYPTAEFGAAAKGIDILKGKFIASRYGKPEEVPGQWVPVNSKSGNVKRVAFVPEADSHEGVDEVFVEFDGGDLYSYQGTKGENMKEIAAQIQKEGGEAIYRELRGRPTTGYKPGQAPKGTSKKGGKPNTPLAGAAHKVDYQYDPTVALGNIQKKPLIPAVKSLFSKNQSLADLSRKQMNEFFEQNLGHTFGNSTLDYIKEIIKLNEAYQYEEVFRANSIEIGKPMDFTIALKYRNKTDPRKIDEEFACKKDWREFLTNGYESEIRLYHGPTEAVGTAKWSWNTETDEPVLEVDYDRENVMRIMESKGYTNRRLYHKLKNGDPAPLSTEYFARVENIDGKSFQRGLKGLSVVLVDQGNCPDDLCNLQPKT